MTQQLPDPLLSEFVSTSQEHIAESHEISTDNITRLREYELGRQGQFDRLTLFNAGAISIALSSISGLVARQLRPFSVHLWTFFVACALLLVAISFGLVRGLKGGQQILLLFTRNNEGRTIGSVRKANRQVRLAFRRHELQPDEDHLTDVPKLSEPSDFQPVLKRLELGIIVTSISGYAAFLYVFASALWEASSVVSPQ